MSTPDPHEAAELISQAGRTTSSVRGTASWPFIAVQLGLGAASSMYLLWAPAPPGPLSTSIVPLIGLAGWIAFLLPFGVVFGRVAKNGFGRRWLVFMAVWSACWVVGMLQPFPWAAVGAGFVIMAASMIGAVREARS